MRQEVMIVSPRQGDQAMTDLFVQHIEPHARKGARSRLVWETVNEHQRHAIRKYFHGLLLKHIALTVKFKDAETGERYHHSKATWKAYFADLFIEPDFVEYPSNETGEIKLRPAHPSTEALSDDEMKVFVLQVEDYCINELRISLPEERPTR